MPQAICPSHGETLEYPHHGSHSLGPAVHEFVRFVPFETAKLEPDMVLLVEPGRDDPVIGGVRSEYMIRVTATGCEISHSFEHVPAVVG